HADHHGLLPDIEVAETADEAHAVKLAGLLFEAADQQHVAVILDEFFGRNLARRLCGAGRGLCHETPLTGFGVLAIKPLRQGTARLAISILRAFSPMSKDVESGADYRG